MDATTYQWIIAGLATVVAGGVGYFLVRIDGDVRYLMKGMVRIEARFKHEDKRRRVSRARPRAKVKP